MERVLFGRPIERDKKTKGRHVDAESSGTLAHIFDCAVGFQKTRFERFFEGLHICFNLVISCGGF